MSETGTLFCTVPFNLCVSRSSFEELHNIRVAYATYEASDMKGLHLDQRTLLRTLKVSAEGHVFLRHLATVQRSVLVPNVTCSRVLWLLFNGQCQRSRVLVSLGHCSKVSADGHAVFLRHLVTVQRSFPKVTCSRGIWPVFKGQC